MTSDYVNVSSYDPSVMEDLRVSGKYKSVHRLISPFHKEAEWYDDCCKPYNSDDYYPSMYAMLKDDSHDVFWKSLYNCFNNVSKI